MIVDKITKGAKCTAKDAAPRSRSLNLRQQIRARVGLAALEFEPAGRAASRPA